MRHSHYKGESIIYLEYDSKDIYVDICEKKNMKTVRKRMKDETGKAGQPRGHFQVDEIGLKVGFPLQALVALHVIQGFHDNNGWYQASYAEFGHDLANANDQRKLTRTDINFQSLGRITTKLMQKVLEDDDTELSRL